MVCVSGKYTPESCQNLPGTIWKIYTEVLPNSIKYIFSLFLKYYICNYCGDKKYQNEPNRQLYYE